MWGRLPLAPPGHDHGTAQLLWHSKGLQEGLGWACLPARVEKGDWMALWQQVLSWDLMGFCSYTPPLNYTGVSPPSSQQESSKLWVLPLESQLNLSHHCSCASAAIHGRAPVNCWMNFVQCWCLDAHHHPLPVSTPASHRGRDGTLHDGSDRSSHF